MPRTALYRLNPWTACEPARFLARHVRHATVLVLAAMLAACASSSRIDTRYSAASQSSRVQFIVLHYTTGVFKGALQILTEGPVSSHYLVDINPTRPHRPSA